MTPADVAFLDPGRGRGRLTVSGLAVALATLPWLGFVPDKVRAAPPVAVARLAERLGLDPAVLAGYGQRAHTRSDHVRLAAGYLGWKSAPADSAAMKDLEQFLVDRRWSMTRRGCCSPWRPSIGSWRRRSGPGGYAVGYGAKP